MSFDVFNQGAAVTALKSTVWTFDLALELVRAMNPFLSPMGFQCLLSGPVLQDGKNARLTLIFLPIKAVQANKELELITWLAETFGKAVNINKLAFYKHGLQFKYEGLLIDVFIGGV